MHHDDSIRGRSSCDSWRVEDGFGFQEDFIYLFKRPSRRFWEEDEHCGNHRAADHGKNDEVPPTDLFKGDWRGDTNDELEQVLGACRDGSDWCSKMERTDFGTVEEIDT